LFVARVVYLIALRARSVFAIDPKGYPQKLFTARPRYPFANLRVVALRIFCVKFLDPQRRCNGENEVTALTLNDADKEEFLRPLVATPVTSGIVFGKLVCG
jgi:hypothetical protein